MFSLLVAVGLFLSAQLLPEPEEPVPAPPEATQIPPGEEVYVSTECRLPGGADCHEIIYQLEILGVPLTVGDFTKEECQALRDELIPGLVVAGIKNEPICVAYAVQRDPV